MRLIVAALSAFVLACSSDPDLTADLTVPDGF